MTEITLEELRSMTDEEVRNMNAYLGKKLVKRYAINALVTVGIVIGTIIVSNKISDKIDNTEN